MNEELKVIISAEISKLQSGLKEASNQVSGFSSTVEKVKSGVGKSFEAVGKVAKTAFVATGAAVTTAATTIVGFATKSAATADNIDKMSQKIGISRKAYQEWDYICGQSGVDVDVFKNGVKTLTTQMDSAAGGSKSAQEAFSALGLTWEDGSGKLKSQETMMEEAIAALSNMENGTERARLAQELFGKAGTELAPILNSGTEGIEALRDRCHELGLVMSDESVDAGVKLGDTIDDVKKSFGAIVTQIGSKVMPIIQKLLDWVMAHMPEIQEVFKTVFGVLEKVVNAAMEVIKELAAKFKEHMPAIKEIVKTCFEAIQVLWENVLKPVFSVLIDVIVDVLSVVAENFPAIKETVKACFDTIKSIWDTVLKPVFDAVIKIVKLLFDKFKEHMPAIMEVVKNAFAGIKDTWDNHLKPCFNAIKSFIETVLLPAFKFVFETTIKPLIETVFKFIINLWNNTLKPVFNGICDFLTGVFTGDWKKAWNGIKSILEGVWNGIKSIIELAIGVIKTVISTAWNAIKTLTSTIFNGIKNTVTNIWNGIKNTITNTVNGIKNTISTVFNAVKTTMSNIFNGAKDSVLGIFDKIKSGISDKINAAKDTVKNVIDKIKGFFNFEWSLPKLKMPHVSITGKFSLAPPKVPKFSVDWYAQGGVFDSTTLFPYGGKIGGLGENGAEAIVPLENNTEWLTKIAKMLSDRMGTGANIIMQVDGKTFAEISVDSINQLTRQKGSLPLVLA